MSEELQNDGFSIEPASDDIQPAEQTETNENPDKGPELATETQNEVKEVVEPVVESEEEKEAKRQAAFNKQYGEKMQLKRDKEALERRLAEVEQSQAQVQAPPPVDDIPNEYDYDTSQEWETAKQLHISNVRANERYQIQLQNQQAQQQTNEAESARQYQEKITTDLNTYTESAKKNGISPEEMQQAANAVGSYGITPDLSLALLADPDGPLITKYLAANPQEVTTLVNMNPYGAGAYLETLKVKAGSLKPKTSSAPNPTTDIQGSGGNPNKDSPLIQGATFE